MKFITIVSAFLFALVESRRRNTQAKGAAAPAAPAAAAKVHAGCKLLTVANCATNTQCHVVAGKCKKNKTNAAPAAAAAAPKHRRNY